MKQMSRKTRIKIVSLSISPRYGLTDGVGSGGEPIGKQNDGRKNRDTEQHQNQPPPHHLPLNTNLSSPPPSAARKPLSTSKEQGSFFLPKPPPETAALGQRKESRVEFFGFRFLSPPSPRKLYSLYE